MKDEDIIKVNNNMALIKEVFKNVIHEGLKGCWALQRPKVMTSGSNKPRCF